MIHYTTDPSVRRKHQKKGNVSERVGGGSHCYDRLKIDQISANDFFFKSCLPASFQAHSLHSHESVHISRVTCMLIFEVQLLSFSAFLLF